MDYEQYFHRSLTVTNEDDFHIILRNIINSIVKKERYKSFEVNHRLFTEADSFLARLYEVTIKGKTEYGNKETNLFIKRIIPGDHLVLIASTAESYRRELYIYIELGKIYAKLQEDACIPDDERYRFVKRYDESTPELIVLENMAVKDFKVYYRMNVVSQKFAEFSIKELAKFHALSFVLERTYPEYFTKKVKEIKHIYVLGDAWKEFVKHICKLSIEAVEGGKKEKLKKFIPVILDKFPKYMEDNASSTCCLCHGDYKTSNVLVKEQDGEPCENIVIDYQFVYYGCPLNDFFHFIFCTTDQAFRKQHFINMKNLYFETLKTFLELFKIDVEDVYPRIMFEKEFWERLDYGLMVSLFIVPFFFAKEQNDGTAETETSLPEAINPDDRFKDRIRGIVDDYIQWGYL